MALNINQISLVYKLSFTWLLVELLLIIYMALNPVVWVLLLAWLAIGVIGVVAGALIIKFKYGGW
jgi:hypothetical protein